MRRGKAESGALGCEIGGKSELIRLLGKRTHKYYLEVAISALGGVQVDGYQFLALAPLELHADGSRLRVRLEKWQDRFFEVYELDLMHYNSVIRHWASESEAVEVPAALLSDETQLAVVAHVTSAVTHRKYQLESCECRYAARRAGSVNSGACVRALDSAKAPALRSLHLSICASTESVDKEFVVFSSTRSNSFCQLTQYRMFDVKVTALAAHSALLVKPSVAFSYLIVLRRDVRKPELQDSFQSQVFANKYENDKLMQELAGQARRFVDSKLASARSLGFQLTDVLKYSQTLQIQLGELHEQALLLSVSSLLDLYMPFAVSVLRFPLTNHQLCCPITKITVNREKPWILNYGHLKVRVQATCSIRLRKAVVRYKKHDFEDPNAIQGDEIVFNMRTEKMKPQSVAFYVCSPQGTVEVELGLKNTGDASYILGKQ